MTEKEFEERNKNAISDYQEKQAKESTSSTVSGGTSTSTSTGTGTGNKPSNVNVAADGRSFIGPLPAGV